MTWRKARACASSGSCVELADWVDGISVRNSRRPATVVDFTTEEWSTFIAAVKAGEFDA